ncbi:Dipeptide transport system permease protein DppC (TC 3.A.1.5.2) [Streptococcus dysgalactiae subsp. dysgalactiae]|nr:Dipeptide transport system permease protein DppC (TC 3.A.1.5.2) [Streptococcus dysgalactiae subsp. dysgalactiae]
MKHRTLIFLQLGIAISLILSILILNIYFFRVPLQTNAAFRNLSPSLNHLFGTDSLGRDMFLRTIKGLSFSLQVGLLGALIGVFIATFFGILAGLGNNIVDKIIAWLIDLFIGMPHLIFMILISFVVGKGARGVIIATAVTHWPSLARLVRNEVYHLKNQEFIQISKSMGKSSYYIVKHHILPLIASQIFIGFILLFPHVILHEASMTFLGFGLSAEQPSVGIILSEAAKHISLGNWWLVIFPGLYLIVIVHAFDTIGETLKKLFYPQTDCS